MAADISRFPTVLLLLIIAVAAHAQTHADAHCGPGTPIPFQSGDKWGYLTTDGVLVQPQFESAGRFFNGEAQVCSNDYCWRIDHTGKLVAPMQPRSAPSAIKFSEGLGAAFNGSHWGFIDRSGRVVIPFQYSFADNFIDGIALVGKGEGKHEISLFINPKGEVSRKFPEGAAEFSEGLAAVRVNGKEGYIRRDGTFAITPRFEGANEFSEGLAAVRISGKMGFIDTAGNVVISPAYDEAFPFYEGLALVSHGQRWGFINAAGEVQIPFSFAGASGFHEGVAAVCSFGGKCGYIDHNGFFVIPPQFDSAMPFCAGVAAVETYRTIPPPRHGLPASFEGRHGWIDPSGHYIWRDATDQIWYSPFIF